MQARHAKMTRSFVKEAGETGQMRWLRVSEGSGNSSTNDLAVLPRRRQELGTQTINCTFALQTSSTNAEQQLGEPVHPFKQESVKTVSFLALELNIITCCLLKVLPKGQRQEGKVRSSHDVKVTEGSRRRQGAVVDDQGESMAVC
jgi:hypothetical protein